MVWGFFVSGGVWVFVCLGIFVCLFEFILFLQFIGREDEAPSGPMLVPMSFADSIG